ncbi:MAG: hypothetical protein ACI4XP_06445 [Acutalibacteraceae bacterium]
MKQNRNPQKAKIRIRNISQQVSKTCCQISEISRTNSIRRKISNNLSKIHSISNIRRSINKTNRISSTNHNISQTNSISHIRHSIRKIHIQQYITKSTNKLRQVCIAKDAEVIMLLYKQ